MPLFVYPQKVRNFHMYKAFQINVPVNSSCTHLLPPPPRGLLRAICSPFQSQGWGICKFCAARVPGICQPRGYSRAFEPHEVSYQNITTQRITEKKEGHRAVTAFSRFYTCISSLLIKIELHRERHPFMFIKLFITCNFTAPIILISISFNVNNFISILKP